MGVTKNLDTIVMCVPVKRRNGAKRKRGPSMKWRKPDGAFKGDGALLRLTLLTVCFWCGRARFVALEWSMPFGG
jgi:hypothetical protein